MSNECVLIVGVRSAQAKELSRAYTHIDFSFITDQQKQTKPCSGNIDRFDRIINMTKFSSHLSHKAYRRHKGYCMVNGGLTSLKQAIEA